MRSRLLGFALLMLAFLPTGCGRRGGLLHADTIVAMNTKGEPVNPATLCPFTATYTYEDHLKKVLAPIGRRDASAPAATSRTGRPRKNIIIYVHGGLNTLKGSTQRASDLAPRMAGDENTIPIAICWDSSLVNNYGRYLLDVREGHTSDGFLMRLVTRPFVAIRDVVEVVLVRSILANLYMVANDVRMLWPRRFVPPAGVVRGAPGHQYVAARTGTTFPVFNAWAAPVREAEDKVFAQFGRDLKPFCHQLGRFSLYLLTFPSKVVTMPLVDVLGQRSWWMMKRTAQVAFRSDREQDSEIRHDEAPCPRGGRAKVPGASGALAMFAEALIARLQDPATGTLVDDYEITLIGHSMGTMILNEFLHRYGDRLATTTADGSRRNLISRVVYMAAACSVRDLDLAVVPFLERHEETTFHMLTLHPDAEAGERQGILFEKITGIDKVDLEPRGSLLVWIDSYFENPITPMDRTAGRWENIVEGMHIFRDVTRQVTLKTFGYGPDNLGAPDFWGGRSPQKHGQFFREEMAFWKPEFWLPHSGGQIAATP